MNTQFLKPANKNILVRNPERGGHLSTEGEYVPCNAYWHRRISDGDVVKVKPAKTTKQEQK